MRIRGKINLHRSCKCSFPIRICSKVQALDGTQQLSRQDHPDADDNGDRSLKQEIRSRLVAQGALPLGVSEAENLRHLCRRECQLRSIVTMFSAPMLRKAMQYCLMSFLLFLLALPAFALKSNFKGGEEGGRAKAHVVSIAASKGLN